MPPMHPSRTGRTRRSPLPRPARWLPTVVVLAGAVTVALAGCGSGGGGGTTSTSTSPPATSPSASSSASPTDSSATGVRITLGVVGSVVVPAGWSHTEGTMTTATIDTPFGYACLDDPSVARADGGCTVELFWGSPVAGAEGRPWAVHQVAGWNHRTDAGPCPVPGSTTDSSASGYGITGTAGAPAQSFARMGSKTAYLDTYTATCGDGTAFHPRIWWLPATHLMVEDVLDNPATPQILASVDYTGTPAGGGPRGSTTAAVRPGTVHGYLVTLSGGRATIDLVVTYANDAAGKAYAAAHAIAYPFDNDFLDVPTGTTVQVPLASGAVCQGGTRVANADPLHPVPVPCATFGTYVATTSPVLVDATVGAGGTVTGLVEVYRP